MQIHSAWLIGILAALAVEGFAPAAAPSRRLLASRSTA